MEKQQLLALNARNLQFFAEGGEAGAPEGGGNDSGGIDPTEGNGAEGTNPTFEAPKTQSELDSIINKSNQKTLENYKKGEAQRIQDAIAEALKKEKDFIRSVGQEVEIRTYRAINRQKEFVGILKEFDQNTVTISYEDDSTQTFEKSEIALIRLALDF